VGPYEGLRLSRRLGITTTEFLSRHTEAGGTVLQTRADDRGCVFLGPRGCTVHPDRPLACRIYPLARWISPEGDESFGHLEPHPQTAGVYGTQGTVDDYLTSQGLAPYFAMADRYGELYDRMVAVLERFDPAEDVDRRTERRAEIDELDAGSLATAWFDIDATVGAYCRERALAVPTDVDALVDLHLQAVGAWLDALEARLEP
jgi:Fe-S-cluster containining protein